MVCVFILDNVTMNYIDFLSTKKKELAILLSHAYNCFSRGFCDARKDDCYLNDLFKMTITGTEPSMIEWGFPLLMNFFYFS